VRNRSCPAVSQMVSLTLLRLTFRTFTLKSTPAQGRDGACCQCCPAQTLRTRYAARGWMEPSVYTDGRRHLLKQIISEAQQQARFSDATISDQQQLRGAHTPPRAPQQ
jgi:hypothetical protein